MNEQQLDELLKRKKQTILPGNDYLPSADFIAAFRCRLRQYRLLLRRWRMVAAAASLLVLCGLFWRGSQAADSKEAVGKCCTMPVKRRPAGLDRLAEVERYFGSQAGVLFVNDELVLFERAEEQQADCRIRLQLFTKLGVPLLTLEFASGGDDYIVLDNDSVSGTIFLNRCDDKDTIVELALRLQTPNQQQVQVAEIFALGSLEAKHSVSNGIIVQIDFNKRPA